MDKVLLAEAKALIQQLVLRMENGETLRRYSPTADQAKALINRMDKYIYGQ